MIRERERERERESKEGRSDSNNARDIGGVT
jgi:hypothetical protein